MSSKATLDGVGRLVLPKPLRDELRLTAGDILDVTLEGDELTLRPRRGATPLQKESGVWVFRSGRPLGAAETNEALRGIRAHRSRKNAAAGR